MTKFILLLNICLVLVVHVCAQKSTRVIAHAPPKYPPAAAAVRASGSVVVNVQIDAIGNVTSATAVSGHGLLRRSSEDAARLWKFSPAADDARESTLTFVYKLKENRESKNNYRAHKLKYRFKKPYTLEVEVTLYPRIDI